MKVEVRLPDMSNVYGHDRLQGMPEEIRRQSESIEEGEDPDWVYGMYMSSAFAEYGYVWGGPPTFPKDRKYRVFGRMVDLHHQPRKCVETINTYDLDLMFLTYLYLPRSCPIYYSGEIAPDYYSRNYKGVTSWAPWSIDPKEFYPTNEKPEYDVSFLGTSLSGVYPIRMDITKHLRSLCEDKGWRYNIKFSRRDDTPIGKDYAKALRSTKVFIFGTSILRYSVRKWFEGMSSGTCILADPPSLATQLGFEDGRNFVSIDLENWKERLEWILDNDKHREKLARNGRKLMLRRHTHEIRVKEMFEVLKAHG